MIFFLVKINSESFFFIYFFFFGKSQSQIVNVEKKNYIDNIACIFFKKKSFKI